MDVSWTECRYCQAGAGSGSKGRTVVETPAGGQGAKGGTLAENWGGAGGFVRGATLLGGGGLAGDKRGTIAESGSTKGKTVVEGPTGGRPKARTVFDSGVPDAGMGPAAPASRLVGWLVTFSVLPTGQDYKLREGRNTVGSDSGECDVVLANESSISGKHAVIVCRDGSVLVRDNDSTNGTFVNGEDIFGRGAVAIKNLDRLRLGRIEFTLYTLQQ